MKEMIEYLQSLGLTEYQSRAMIVLFCKENAIAKDICKFGGIRRTKIYQVMKSLEDKGLITYKYSKPREYVGVNAVEAMDKLLEKQEKSLIDLKALKNKKVIELEKLDLKSTEKERMHPMWDVEQYKSL